MGIHGLLRELGQPPRLSLAKLASTHYATHSRPLRLAIDISIWLFQIQSGKGGSNPALRTFYYRLLRLLTLNIHPLFVFDGPNKPLFKRHKRVGGGGAKVVSVPEFLAKQLLKHFGFPWHVAPGEAEAECALLQREGVVDAVLSEDVDTLMFGSGVTIRNWSPVTSAGGTSSTKTPTHVDVYRAEETKVRSRGIDREGMVLVALMSGGDYLPEGIPGCGPKVASDAARAGFGRDLCALSPRRDPQSLQSWKERLQHEIRTNESKFFSRKNTALTLPEDFPNLEVLGYYTHPCVSTPEKVARLKKEVLWDQPIDFVALRGFAADAFDWRCRGGACKFIKNLAPAVLMRQLRLRGSIESGNDDVDAQEKSEREIVHAIHSTRNHASTDGELEYRISYMPVAFVPIDLDAEEEDDQFIPAGGVANLDDSEAESEVPSTQPTATDNDTENDGPPRSPGKKKRTFRPFDPSAPEKLWILKPFLQAGCPLLVEDWEARLSDPKTFLKEKRKGKAVGKKNAGESTNTAGKKGKGKGGDMPPNALMAYAKVTKAGVTAPDKDVTREGRDRGLPLRDVSSNASARVNDTSTRHDLVPTGEQSVPPARASNEVPPDTTSMFRLPATQIPNDLQGWEAPTPFASTQPPPLSHRQQKPKSQKQLPPTQPQAQTPKRNTKKRPPVSPAVPNLLHSSGAVAFTPRANQRTIENYYSPSPRRQNSNRGIEVVDLVSSSPPRSPLRLTSGAITTQITGARTPSLGADTRYVFQRDEERNARVGEERVYTGPVIEMGTLPNTIKRRRHQGLKRWATEPEVGSERDHVDVDADVDEEEVEVLSSSPPGLFVPALSFRAQTPEREEDRTTSASEPEWWLGDSESAIAGVDMLRRAAKYLSPSDAEELLAMLPPPRLPAEKAKDATQTGANSTLRSATAPAAANPLFQHPKPTPPPSQPQPRRRSPRQQQIKKRILLRDSLEGWWKEVAADTDTAALDLTGDGSGWKKSGGRAEIVPVARVEGDGQGRGKGKGWRKSDVEVLDLTGA